MVETFNLHGIQIFGISILGLISDGEKESIEVVVKEMSNSNLVCFLREKYKESLTDVFCQSKPYDIQEWENALCSVSCFDESDAKRKFCLSNQETDGLLFVVSLIFELISRQCNMKKPNTD